MEHIWSHRSKTVDEREPTCEFPFGAIAVAQWSTTWPMEASVCMYLAGQPTDFSCVLTLLENASIVFGNSNAVGKLLERTRSNHCKNVWGWWGWWQPKLFYAFSLHSSNSKMLRSILVIQSKGFLDGLGPSFVQNSGDARMVVCKNFWFLNRCFSSFCGWH